MRVEALAILALTSCLGVGAIRPRLPSAPPYPVPSGPGNASMHGLTGTAAASSPSNSAFTPAGTGSVHKPTGNATSQAPSKCSGQTLNVLDASLDWWYTRTLYNIVSTISVQFNRNDSTTGWTVLPATTPFDLESAMASPTCETSYTWNTVWNMSLWDVSCTPAPTPVAASTTIITQTAYYPLNATTGSGRIPDVVRTPPPATITIPSSAGTYAEGTQFVFFSAYEIVTKSQSTYGNGSVGCAEATQTYNMEAPFSFEYTDGDVNGTKEVGAGVTGDVNPAFLGVVGETAVAGSWVAAPTVAVVVQDIYVAEAVLAMKAGPAQPLMLTTETILQTPEPTLPPGFTTGPPDTAFPSIGFTGRIESTAPSLDVPTPAQNTKPGNTKPNGPKPTQTTGPDGKPTPVNSPGNGPKPTRTKGPVDNIVSAIVTLATPTNALEVLQQATRTFTTSTNPTAEAIMHGLTPGPNNHIETGPDGKVTLVIGGATITGNSQTEFIVGAATLTPGGTIVQHGTTVSLDSSQTVLVVNGQTMTAPNAGITAAPVLTIGGTTYGASNGPTYVIQGDTLTPGGVITVDGTTISLGPSGSSIVVNGLTQDLGTAPLASVTAPPILTIGGETFTAINNGFTYVINGETLTPGEIETVTVDGNTYVVSLGSGATVLVIETVGPNGAPTATTTETLIAGSGSQTTITNIVDASAGSTPSGGPSQSVTPSMQDTATSLKIQRSTVCVFISTLLLAIWL